MLLFPIQFFIVVCILIKMTFTHSLFEIWIRYLFMITTNKYSFLKNAIRSYIGSIQIAFKTGSHFVYFFRDILRRIHKNKVYFIQNNRMILLYSSSYFNFECNLRNFQCHIAVLEFHANLFDWVVGSESE